MICYRCGGSFEVVDRFASRESYEPIPGRVKISSYYGHSIYLDLCQECANLLLAKLQALEFEFTRHKPTGH